MTLYPTKTRLALLRAVANSQVVNDYTDDVLWFPDAPDSWQDCRKVTVRIAELAKAGWVAESHPEDHPGCLWTVTDAGRAVLDAHREA